MARTISRTHFLRGTQPAQTRDVVPGDAVAPRRRWLSGAGPALPNRSADPAAPAHRPLSRAGDSGDARGPRTGGTQTRLIL